MKAAALVLALLLMVSGDHVSVHAAGCAVSVPAPLLVLCAELATVALLAGMIWRAARRHRFSPCLPRRMS